MAFINIVRFARMGLAMLASFMVSTPAYAQFTDYAHDPGRPQGYSSLGLLEFNDSMARIPSSFENTHVSAATISQETLKHPLSARARRRLSKALHLAKLGEHAAA